MAMSQDSIAFLQKHNIRSYNHGWILVFMMKELKCYTPSNVFGDLKVVYKTDLFGYLENTRVLIMEPDYPDLASEIESVDSDNDEDVDIKRYCDDIACKRAFPHEHIIPGRGASFAGALDSNDAAKEVFASNAFYKI